MLAANNPCRNAFLPLLSHVFGNISPFNINSQHPSTHSSRLDRDTAIRRRDKIRQEHPSLRDACIVLQPPSTPPNNTRSVFRIIRNFYRSLPLEIDYCFLDLRARVVVIATTFRHRLVFRPPQFGHHTAKTHSLTAQPSKTHVYTLSQAGRQPTCCLLCCQTSE